MNDSSHPSRFIDLAGSINFRDFGGYRVPGGRIKWRKLFRCGSLGMLEASSHAEFARLDISVICDLRRDDEIETSPSPTEPPFHCRQHIPIATGSSPRLRASLEDPTQNAGDRVRFMTDITRELARDHHDAYRRLFESLLAAEGGFLLHCSAGKDRTGFGAALILSALGVDEATVMEDYLLSNPGTKMLMARMRARMQEVYGRQIDDESIRAVSGVRAEYLAAALDEVRARHGSLDGYLEAIGVDRRVREELRRRLVEA